MDIFKGFRFKLLGWRALAGLGASLLAISDPSFAQNAISLGRNFLPDPAKLLGSTGGNVSLASIAGISDNCRGFANAAPNHTITLTETFPMMDFLVYSDNINDDPTMLIKGSNGVVICADDQANRLSPQASSRLTKGTYEVWVGSKGANQSFRYTLSLSEIRQK